MQAPRGLKRADAPVNAPVGLTSCPFTWENRAFRPNRPSTSTTVKDLVQAVSDLFAAVLGRLGHVGRARGRSNIREDLDLLGQLRDSPEFGSDSAASGFLVDHITTEVARYSGVESAPRKPWGSVVFGLIITAVLAFLAYRLSEDGFDWFSLPAGAGAALFLVVTVEMLAKDESATEDTKSPPKEEESTS